MRAVVVCIGLFIPEGHSTREELIRSIRSELWSLPCIFGYMISINLAGFQDLHRLRRGQGGHTLYPVGQTPEGW
jgi:hypothetical protein